MCLSSAESSTTAINIRTQSLNLQDKLRLALLDSFSLRKCRLEERMRRLLEKRLFFSSFISALESKRRFKKIKYVKMNWVIFLPEIRYRKQSEDDIKSTIEETIHSPESRKKKN